MQRTFQVLILLLLSVVVTFSQWIKTDGFDGISVTAISAVGTNLVAGTANNGIFRSTNDGASWTSANTGLPESTVVYCFAVNASLIYAGKGKQIFVSTNNGSSWSGINSGLSFVQQIYSIIYHGSSLFAGTTNGLFRSTNNGASWDSVVSNLPSNTQISCFASNGAALLAGTSGGSVYRSVNNGTTWVSANSGLSAMSVYAFAVSGATVYAGTQDGIFVSTNNGESWVSANTGLASNLVTRSFALSEQDLFAAVGGQVYLLKNGTSQWMSVQSGMIAQNVIALVKNGSSLFAANFSGGIWRRPVSEMITSVADRDVALPALLLDQNFPNPFNPSTTIRYVLPSSAYVRLTIYDLLGREVETLVDEEQPAGWKEVQWNAVRHAGGVYIMQIRANDYTESKKIALMK